MNQVLVSWLATRRPMRFSTPKHPPSTTRSSPPLLGSVMAFLACMEGAFRESRAKFNRERVPHFTPPDADLPSGLEFAIEGHRRVTE